MKRINGLDGIRGIAALGVIAFHIAVLGGYTGQNILFNRTIGRGDCFVRLFFMLSSFSLMCGYYNKFISGTFSIESFLLKRVHKIYPLFLIALIVQVSINIATGVAINIWDFLGSASLLFALMPLHRDSLVFGGWSMGIQMVFYLFFPTFLILVKTKKRAWITFAFSILTTIVYCNFYGLNAESPHINIIRQGIYFTVGAVLFYYKDFLEKLVLRDKIIFTILCIIIEIICFSLFPTVNEDLIMLLAFSALIILQIIGLDYCMNNVVFRFLGRISFEMYLIHPIIYRVCNIYNLQGFISNSIDAKKQFIVHYFVILILTIALSFLVQVFLNKIVAKQIIRKEKYI